jgi:hypothetical protein
MDPAPRASAQADLIWKLEASSGGDARQVTETILRRLFAAMDPLIGAIGFSALVKRAVHLTKGIQGCFTGLEVQITSELQLERIGRAVEEQGPDNGETCARHLLAMLLTLSCTFIGDALTWRALRRAWPDSNIDTPAAPQKEEP